MKRGAAVRVAVASMCIAGALVATGCKEAQDIREEMGWSQQREAPPPPPPVNLDDRWIPADTAVAETTQAQWASRWWLWAGRFDGKAPYQDRDGARCALHQDGPVWFLAGTDGSFDAVRNCTIPADRHLFVPLIAWSVAGGEPGETQALSCTQKQQRAANLADHVYTGLVLLDGRPIGQYQRMRAAGGCFAVASGDAAVATDGYWLMLKPLPPGQHTLAIAAAYREGPRQVLQNFQYTLEVQGAGSPDAAEASADAPESDAGGFDDAADLADGVDAAAE
ncbi:hypothetical protein [Lysobacter arvi]|uniref:Lipoprotein n=1 Tax=Lysobacter arvi TaxID=3038776 RepID=A0ABU1C8S8_9GAMM|nr:hypothetical protein [Lysobacter arvi]MDR0181591.1 hypothetical protein [Lysobacter arvi]